MSPLHHPRGWRVHVDNDSAEQRGRRLLLVTPDSDRIVNGRVLRRG